jgi:hypothetical protein
MSAEAAEATFTATPIDARASLWASALALGDDATGLASLLCRGEALRDDAWRSAVEAACECPASARRDRAARLPAAASLLGEEGGEDEDEAEAVRWLPGSESGRPSSTVSIITAGPWGEVTASEKRLRSRADCKAGDRPEKPRTMSGVVCRDPPLDTESPSCPSSDPVPFSPASCSSSHSALLDPLGIEKVTDLLAEEVGRFEASLWWMAFAPAPAPAPAGETSGNPSVCSALWGRTPSAFGLSPARPTSPVDPAMLGFRGLACEARGSRSGPGRSSPAAAIGAGEPVPVTPCRSDASAGRGLCL